MVLELRRSFIAAAGLASTVIIAICFWIVRDTVNAASMPVQLAFSVLFIAAYVSMFQSLRMPPPLVLVSLWPALDR